MMMRRFLFSLLLGLGSLAGAQSIPLLPRVPVADSSLFLCTDSTKTVTRACKFSLVQQRLSYKPFDSLMSATKLRFSGTTSTITGGAGGMTIQSGTGADRRMTFAVTDASSGVQTPFYLRANAVNGTTSRAVVNGSLAFENNGNTTAPSLNWADAGATGLGLYRPAGDTVAFVAGSTSRIKLTTTGIFPSADNTYALGNSSLRWSDIRANTATFSGAITVASCTGCGGGVTYPLTASNGTVGAPSYSWSSQSSLGLYFIANNAIGNSGRFLGPDNSGAGTDTVAYGFASSPRSGMRWVPNSLDFMNQGTTVLRIAGNQTATFSGPILSSSGSSGAPGYAFSASATTGFWYSAGDIVAQTTRLISNGIVQANGAGGASSVAFGIGGASTGLWTSDFANVIFSNSGTQSLTVSGGASTTLTGGIGSMTVNAGTGNSRRLDLRTTTSAGTATTAVRFNELQQSLFASGTAANPSITFAADTALGFYRAASNDVRLTQASNLMSRWFQTGAAQMQTLLGGATAWPSEPNLALDGDPNTGIFWPGSDTLGVSTNGVTSMRVSGGATATWMGGAGHTIIRSGTGAFRYLKLQITDGSSNAIQAANFTESSVDFSSIANYQFTLGAGTAAVPILYVGNGSGVKGFYSHASDTLGISTGGTRRLLVANQGATGAGDVQLCITATGVTGVITQGATCGSSTSKVKTRITPLLGASTKTMALRPVSYSYLPGFYGGRSELGLIAEEAAKVDPRLAFYAERDDKLPNGQVIKKGDPINVNDRAVLALLLATVQQQQRQIDSLMVLVKKGKP